MPSKAELEILFGGRHMDLFNLNSAPNHTKVKTRTRPRTAHEVPLLTVTASHVIDMENAAWHQNPQGHHPPQRRNASTTKVTLKIGLEEEVAAMRPLVNKRRRKRGNNEAKANALPKVLRRDHDTFRPEDLPESGLPMENWMLTFAVATSSLGISIVVPLKDMHLHYEAHIIVEGSCAAGVDKSEPASNPIEARDFPSWSTHEGKSLASMGLDAGSLLSTPAAQDPSTATKSMSDPVLLSYVKLQPYPEQDITHEDVATAKVNIQFSMGSPDSGRSSSVPSVVGSSGGIYQPGLRFEQEVRVLKKARSKIARWDQRIQIKAAFEEFKKYEDDKVEQRCTEMDARLDELSVNFNEELYPHMLTAIAGRRWVIGHGLRLVIMKCPESSQIRKAFTDVVSAGLSKGMSEGLKYGIEDGKAGRDLADVEAYDPEANSKLVKSLKDLKDLKYPMVDQLERLKHAPMELIMASLHLESDTGEDAPQ
nr:hypothetical protein [Tanacetum cinerariifolium]